MEPQFQPTLFKPAPGVQRRLVFKGKMSILQAVKRFHGRIPLHAEFDEMLCLTASQMPPTLTSNAVTSLIHTGTFLAYPGRGRPFPGLFEYKDPHTGLWLCLDTRFCSGRSGIAVVSEGDFSLQFNGKKIQFIPHTAPAVLDSFPQAPGWYKYHLCRKLPVLRDGVEDDAGMHPGRFFQGIDGPWFGALARATNYGNSEEKYVHAHGGPSNERAVFVWEYDYAAQAPARKGNSANRRIIVMPGGNAPIVTPGGPTVIHPPRGFHAAQRDWTERMILHELDPAHCPDPGPPPMPEQYLPSPKAGKA
ncbi:MAG: hypothetical protein PHQ80_00020 [Candidatus ainarchaeum sp.]|nr:hypothetical protein [Candidatus ainarchaeum sp.]MDD5096193.1 hypothetical protein [Candidatus ainarchaeum sp.]